MSIAILKLHEKKLAHLNFEESMGYIKNNLY